MPALNQEFIEENPPMKRVLAVQDEPQFIMDAFFDLKCVRPMPVYSVPGLIDHF
ncbi:major capsid protein [Escherichia coli]